MNDAVIMKVTGHRSLKVFNNYSTVDLRAMRGAMDQAASANPRLLP